MKKTVITQGCTIEELVNELEFIIHSKSIKPDHWGQILAEAVPDLTKAQAARMLGGSKAHIDELVKAGYLQETPGQVEKYQMVQVFRCLLEGRTGRKPGFNLESIINTPST